MSEAPELYELTGDLPELDRPVLVQAMTGFVDAGGATRLARDQLLAADGNELLVRFDIDALLDYRSRRPTMQFVEDHWESYEEPQLGIFRAVDEQGTPFLLLTGPEPDLAWERFTASVIDLVERLNVRLTVGFNAIPMAVPHTRPTGVTAHASKRELIAGYEPWLQRVQVPGSAGHLLEYRLGQQGHDAMGFAVHVPHYLAQAAYPAAAVTLLESVQRVTGLDLPADALRESARRTDLEITRQVEGSEEVGQVVHALEEQYDAFTADRENLLAEDGEPMPTAEELGAEFERFLAEQQGRGDSPES